MLTKKQTCSICHKIYSKSKLKECVTIDDRIILCCEKCCSYVRPLK